MDEFVKKGGQPSSLSKEPSQESTLEQQRSAPKAVERVTSANALDVDDEEFARLLEAADQLTRESHFGRYGRFESPFTRQFKAELRSSFPKDQDTFAQTDKKQHKAIMKALRMRGWTFFTYFLFCSIAFLLSAAITHPESFPENFVPDFLLGWGVLVLYAISVGVLAVGRNWIRRDHLDGIDRDATQFAIYFLRQIDDIHTLAINAVQNSEHDHMNKVAWPDRAAGWIKIALWYGRRLENVDRYVTAAAWKAESSYRWIERTFVCLKYLLGVLVWFAILASLISSSEITGSSVAAVVIVLITFPIASFFIWQMWFQKNNAFWAEKFREHLTGFDHQKTHIFDQIARHVKVDKEHRRSEKRNVEKA